MTDQPHATDHLPPLAMLHKRPKHQRCGYARPRYALFFVLDTAIVLLLGIMLCGFAQWLFGDSFLLKWFFITVGQIIGHVVMWIYLSKVFRIHEVRRWHFHLAMHLWFGYVLQFGFLVPLWGGIEESMMAYVNGEVALSWIVILSVFLALPLFLSKIGLWLTLHSALRVHYPGKGFANEYRVFFRPQTGRDVMRALEARGSGSC